jgi:two-component system probable response regulator PhcQ
MTQEITKSPFSILFVDDEENARKYFDKGLKNIFNVRVAASVDEAQKIIEEHHQNIAVVITDQRMPGGNGVKLLRFLRENHPRIIRLLTTAYSDLTEAIDAVNSGEIFRYIQKPWDFNLLKTELAQAMEVFELRLETRNLLNEKIMVKRRMTKIERVKALFFLAKNLNFLRFPEVSVQNFIKRFASNVTEDFDNADWQDFDFGKSDVLEAKFFLEVIEKVQKELPFDDNYNFDAKLDSSKLRELLKDVKIDGEFEVKINQKSFEKIIKKLLEISSETTAITAQKTENGAVINFNFSNLNLPENENIFIANPQKPVSDFYVNLLLCHFLAGHHGGSFDAIINGKNLNCSLKLPSEPEKSVLASDEFNSMENVILSTMLC